MIVKYFTAQQRLASGDKKEAKTGFYWQAQVEDDPWIGQKLWKRRQSTASNAALA